MIIKVKGQAEFDAAVKAGNTPDVIEGYIETTAKFEFLASGSATVRASGSATVTAYDSATVTAYDSATVTAYDSATVTAYDSATVRASGSATVRASDSATVRASDSATVTASGSATVRASDSATVRASDSATVTASGSATVTAYDSATVRATGSVFVRLFGAKAVAATAGVIIAIHGTLTASVDGGQRIQMETFKTPAEWCEYYGIETKDGLALVYKGVSEDWNSPRGTSYAPGTTPEASDWDGYSRECGGGLHFSPTPHMTLQFHGGASKFLGCWVPLDEMAVHPQGSYPEKCKARRVALPCFEVDIHGRVVEPKKEAA